MNKLKVLATIATVVDKRMLQLHLEFFFDDFVYMDLLTLSRERKNNCTPFHNITFSVFFSVLIGRSILNELSFFFIDSKNKLKLLFMYC